MFQDHSRTHSKREASNSTPSKGVFTQRPFAVQTKLDVPLQGGRFTPRPFAPTIQTKSIKDRFKSKFRSLFGKRRNEDERFQGSRPRSMAVYENETEHRETNDEPVGEWEGIIIGRGNDGLGGPSDNRDMIVNTNDVEGEGEYTKPVGEWDSFNRRGNDGLGGPSDDNDKVGNTDVEGEGEYTKYDDDIEEFYESAPSTIGGDQEEIQIEGDGEIQIEGDGELQIEGGGEIQDDGEIQIEGDGEIFKPKGEKKHPKLRPYKKRTYRKRNK